MAEARPRQRGNELGETTATVAAEVAARRNELGLTRRELANRLTAWGRRFSADAVQKLEASERRIDVDDLYALAAALDVPTGRLLNSGVGTGRLTWSGGVELSERNPLLDKAIHTAVVDNRESRADLLDYIEGAIHRAEWQASWGRFLAEVRDASDADAAALIASRLRDEPAFQPLDSGVIAALILGGNRERAERIVAIAGETDGREG